MRGAIALVPIFETAGIKSTVCGPESFTPDHKPLIGKYFDTQFFKVIIYYN